MSSKHPEPSGMMAGMLLALQQDGACEGVPLVLSNIFLNLVVALWCIREGGWGLGISQLGKDEQGQ